MVNHDLFERTVSSRTPVYLSGDGVNITFQTRITSVADGVCVLHNTVPVTQIRAFMASQRFALQVQMLRLTAERVTPDATHLLFPLATAGAEQSETRADERFAFGAEERVECRFINPYDERTELVKPVIDMSASGLSLQTHFTSELFAPGLTIGDLRVLIDGEAYARHPATVVYSRKLMDLEGRLRRQVGVRFGAP